MMLKYFTMVISRAERHRMGEIVKPFILNIVRNDSMKLVKLVEFLLSCS